MPITRMKNAERRIDRLVEGEAGFNRRGTRCKCRDVQGGYRLRIIQCKTASDSTGSPKSLPVGREPSHTAQKITRRERVISFKRSSKRRSRSRCRLGLRRSRLFLRVLNVLRIVGLVAARVITVLLQILQFRILLGAGCFAIGLALRLLLLLRGGSGGIGGLRHGD